MADFDTKMQEAVVATNNAHALMHGAMAEFQAHIAAFNWKAAEDARLRVVANMEAYLDGMVAVYKTTEG